MASKSFTVEILGDARSAKKAFAEVEGHSSSLGAKLMGVTRAAGLVAGGVTAIGAGLNTLANKAKPAIMAASDLNESINKTEAIFGKSSKAIVEWSKTTARSMGQSRQQALDGAATFAMFGKQAGLSGDQLVKFAQQNSKLASDLASFHNADPSEVIHAMGAALRGEYEPMRRFNVLIDEGSMKSAALSEGISGVTKKLNPQQKVLAANALMWKQTTDAQGDYAKTAGGVANTTRTMTALQADQSVTLGQSLLPLYQQWQSLNGKLGQMIGEYLPKMLEKAKPYLDGFAKWIREDVSPWIDQKLIPALKDIGGMILDYVVPALKSMADYYVNTWAPMLSDLWSWVKEKVGPALKDLGKWVQDDVAPAMKRLGDWINTSLVPALKDAATWIGDNVVPAVKKMAEWVKDNAGPAIRSLADWINREVVPALKAFGRWIGDEVVPRLMSIVNFFKDHWTGVKETFGLVFDFFKTRLEGFKETINGIVNFIGGIFKGDWKRVWEGVVDVATGLFKTMFGNLPEILLKALGAVASGLVDVGKAIGGAVVDGFKSAFSGLLDFLKTLLQPLVSFYNAVMPGSDVDPFGGGGGGGSDPWSKFGNGSATATGPSAQRSWGPGEWYGTNTRYRVDTTGQYWSFDPSKGWVPSSAPDWNKVRSSSNTPWAPMPGATPGAANVSTITPSYIPNVANAVSKQFTNPLANPYAAKTWNLVSAALGGASRYGLTFQGIRGDEAHERRKSDHNTWDALDIGTGKSAETRRRVAEEIAANAKALGVKYIIEGQRKWTATGGWQKFANKDHEYHVHTSFLRPKASGFYGGRPAGAAGAAGDDGGGGAFGGGASGSGGVGAGKGGTGTTKAKADADALRRAQEEQEREQQRLFDLFYQRNRAAAEQLAAQRAAMIAWGETAVGSVRSVYAAGRGLEAATKAAAEAQTNLNTIRDASSTIDERIAAAEERLRIAREAATNATKGIRDSEKDTWEERDLNTAATKELRDAEDALAKLRDEKSGIGKATAEAEERLAAAQDALAEATLANFEAARKLADMGPNAIEIFSAYARAAGVAEPQIQKIVDKVNAITKAVQGVPDLKQITIDILERTTKLVVNAVTGERRPANNNDPNATGVIPVSGGSSGGGAPGSDWSPDGTGPYESQSVYRDGRWWVYQGGQWIPATNTTALAAGGPVRPGGTYWVGEQGPELFIPSVAGRIVPNDASMAMAAGGGLEVTINVAGSVVTDRELTRSVVDGLRRAGMIDSDGRVLVR